MRLVHRTVQAVRKQAVPQLRRMVDNRDRQPQRQEDSLQAQPGNQPAGNHPQEDSHQDNCQQDMTLCKDGGRLRIEAVVYARSRSPSHSIATTHRPTVRARKGKYNPCAHRFASNWLSHTAFLCRRVVSCGVVCRCALIAGSATVVSPWRRLSMRRSNCQRRLGAQ
jgi:hypothetical protein